MKLTHTNRDRTDRKHLYSVWLFRIIYDPDLFLQVWIFFRERDVAAQCVITGANLAKFKSAVKPGKKTGNWFQVTCSQTSFELYIITV